MIDFFLLYEFYKGPIRPIIIIIEVESFIPFTVIERQFWKTFWCLFDSEISCHNDQVQSVSWKEDGLLLASSCRDKTLRIFDVRTKTVVQVGSCSNIFTIKYINKLEFSTWFNVCLQ